MNVKMVQLMKNGKFKPPKNYSNKKALKKYAEKRKVLRKKRRITMNLNKEKTYLIIYEENGIEREMFIEEKSGSLVLNLIQKAKVLLQKFKSN